MRGLGALVMVALFALLASPAHAQERGFKYGAGAVIELINTPHIWVSDDAGVLHWAGDTRALAGRSVNWQDRHTVTADYLREFRRGDPWLSFALVKIGDAI